MSKLLFNEKPIMLIPSLAKKLGLNKAIILQQIHHCLTSSKHMIEGRKWIYHTYEEWQLQMPFWSESTIKKTIRSLEKQGFLISANWNRLKIDEINWYTIDYEKVEELDTDLPLTNNQVELEEGHDQSSNQMEPKKVSDCTVEEVEMNKAIPEITSETSTKKKDYIPVSKVIGYLNRKIDTS